MGSAIKLVILLGGIALAFYVGAWVLFVGGLIQLIDAVKATPVESYGLAVGLLKAFSAAPVGWLLFALTLVFVK